MGWLTNFLQWINRNQSLLWRLAFVLSMTFFSAKLLNRWVAFRYFPVEVESVTYSDRFSDLDFKDPSSYIPTIISRNVFNSERQNDTGRPRVATDSELFPTSLAIELLGTVVFENSRFSVALIKDRSSNRADYFGLGEAIQGAMISKIERFRVILENNGRLEFVELKTQSKLNMAPQRVIESSNQGLEEISDNRFAIPKAMIDDVMGRFDQVLTQARMVPNLTPENKTDGYRVFQIKPDSIYEKLGLQNNDIISRVNGTYLDSFEKATSLLTALRNEKTISLDIVRDGVRLSYTYEVR